MWGDKEGQGKDRGNPGSCPPHYVLFTIPLRHGPRPFETPAQLPVPYQRLSRNPRASLSTLNQGPLCSDLVCPFVASRVSSFIALHVFCPGNEDAAAIARPISRLLAVAATAPLSEQREKCRPSPPSQCDRMAAKTIVPVLLVGPALHHHQRRMKSLRRIQPPSQTMYRTLRWNIC